jgi:hypothetical protein
MHDPNLKSENTVSEPSSSPRVGILMGSQSDWETMRHAAEMLEQLGVAFEARVVSAHRTPDLLFEYAAAAEGRGLKVIVAGAGGAAHLPGMCAAKTVLPVLGVPVESRVLHGVDSLLSIVHAGHRARRCGQCRSAGRRHPRDNRRGARGPAQTVPRGTDARGPGCKAGRISRR